jgi:GxxExxY protein
MVTDEATGVVGSRLIHAELTRRILSAAMQVHAHLGPGLLEGIYRACFARQLALDGLAVKQEVSLPISYKGLVLDYSCRADVIVDGTVLIELKAVERLLPIHEAQTLTYLKLSNLPVGLLINFNVPSLKNGFRRFIR